MPIRWEYLPDNYAATETSCMLAIRRRRWTRRHPCRVGHGATRRSEQHCLAGEGQQDGCDAGQSGQQVTGSVGAQGNFDRARPRLAGGPGNPGKFGLAIFTVQALAEVRCSTRIPGEVIADAFLRRLRRDWKRIAYSKSVCP